MSERPIIIPITGTTERAVDALAFHQGGTTAGSFDASSTTLTADTILHTADKA